MLQSGIPQAQVGGSHVTLTFDHGLTDDEVEDLKLNTNALNAFRVPPIVKAAYDREEELRFEQSSEPDVGRLLSLLAAIVPSCGRVLELGTGAGVGLAWIVHGLGQRNDVGVVSVELDPQRADRVQAAGWPDWVSIIVGDGAELVRMLGSFDLIFSDTPGKICTLQATITALPPGGVLLLDDMDLPSQADPERRARVASMHGQLFGNHPTVLCTDLALSSGVILAVRQRL